MRLEKQRQAELARRQGSTKRTILQIIWFAIAFAIAYFAANIIFDAGYIDKRVITRSLTFISNRVYRDYFATGIVVFAIFLVIQFFIQFGFLLGNPDGRRKTGHASARAQTEDPLENRFDT
ncbi:MAG TPA: hypothetical protein VLL52_08125 [Anaerolineae bacterium]|nr:hypothetical protein [Anaerolineae bacterium]